MAGNNPSPVKRDVIKGWTNASVRRHTKWLYSIDAPALDGVGFALTFTMRNTPDTAAELHAARRAWIKRVERMGATRVHWVIEWQRRGTPHIHAAVYFPEDALPPYAHALLLTHWIAVADERWGASLQAQHYDTISGPLGWLKYLSKHASRGVRHYQRMNAPRGWERSGRLWGHTGRWPADAPMRFDMPRDAYWRYRRLVRAWRVADARKSGDASRIGYARRMLASGDRRLSEVRGVSDWVPEPVAMEVVSLLIAEGFAIESHPEPQK